MNIRTSRDLLAAITVAAAATGANAQLEKLLIVDLSVPNQVTITSTGANSAATVSGSDGIGVLLEGIYGGPSASGLFASGTGDLVSTGNSSDGTPGLFNSTGNAGLNFWSWTDDASSDFTAGSQAFSGSATWTIDADDYADLLDGTSSGTIWAFADTDDDIAGATAIGTWNLIPAPSTAALLGLGGLAAVRRRR